MARLFDGRGFVGGVEGGSVFGGGVYGGRAVQELRFPQYLPLRDVARGYMECTVWLYGRCRIARRDVPCGYMEGAHP